MQKYITWQPGNGTRYDVILTRLDVDVYGQKAGTWMVVGPWTARARVMFLAEGGVLSFGYVGEKMDIGPHDASVVAMMVAPHIGRQATTLDNLFEHYPGAPEREPNVTTVP
jgi:hypothetical protein